MAVPVIGRSSSTIYGKGDICLKINPFDNYRLFTLYEDWMSDDRKPLDISNGQKIFLVFKSRNKEIRIPEYDTTYSGFTVDKVNGQVLFKISQKNAVDILDMDTRVFYITRLYETTDMSGEKVIASDEEVIYTGQWKDENSNAVEEYTSQVKKLQDIVEERNASVTELQTSNANLIEQNVNLVSELNKYKDEYEKLLSQISEYENKLSEYESGVQYDGMVVGEGTHHTIISNKEYTEEQMAEVIRGLESTMLD